MNVAPASTQKDATVLTEQEGCVARIIRNTNRKGPIKMKKLDAINIRIASKPIMELLKEEGLIYQGEDGELHVREQKNIPTQTAKS